MESNLGRATFSQAKFLNRSKFPEYLNFLGLKGKAVEVGTHRGAFASEFLKEWHGHLTCVDHWKSGYDPTDPASGGNRENDKIQAEKVLNKYRPRITILHESSYEAAYRFEEDSLDFVYLDGCHQYKDMYQDLTLWWSKIRPTGVIAGHDVLCPGELNGGWSQTVQPVLLNFFSSRRITTIELVLEEDGSPWSWLVHKKGCCNERS